MVPVPSPVIQKDHGSGALTDHGAGVTWAALGEAPGTHDRGGPCDEGQAQYGDVARV